MDQHRELADSSNRKSSINGTSISVIAAKVAVSTKQHQHSRRSSSTHGNGVNHDAFHVSSSKESNPTDGATPAKNGNQKLTNVKKDHRTGIGTETTHNRTTSSVSLRTGITTTAAVDKDKEVTDAGAGQLGRYADEEPLPITDPHGIEQYNDVIERAMRDVKTSIEKRKRR